MNFAAVYHQPMSEYAFALDDTHYVFRLRAQAGDLSACTFWYADRAAMGPLGYRPVPMERVCTDALLDWFEVRLSTPLDRISYYFEISDGQKTAYFIGGVFQATAQAERSEGFQFSYNHRADRLVVPQWAADAVVYNIFPDSFATATADISRRGTAKPWRDTACASLLGGTLNGIRENLDYVRDMGFTCMYLNPIFAAQSYHKYDTLDHFSIDPCFGTLEDMRRLVTAAHAKGMRIILDGVFNHISSRHPFFQDVLQNAAQSKYYRWFYKLPERPVFPAPGEMPDYACFSYVAQMPKMDLSNQEACAYFCDVGQYWLRELDIDGWRLDVANEINDGFLRAFRQAVKAVKPDALIVGEVWEDGSRYLQGDMLDACMNYDFRRFATQFFAKKSIDASALAVRMNWLMTRYKEPALSAQLNLLDGHDVNRFLSECDGQCDAMELAVVFQMTLPGMPSVFYGDERGLTGTTEPAYRQAMDWHAAHPLQAHYARLIRLRREHPALRRGRYRQDIAQGDVFGYSMRDENECIHVLLNRGEGAFAVPPNSAFADSAALMQKGYQAGVLAPGGYVVQKMNNGLE